MAEKRLPHDGKGPLLLPATSEEITDRGLSVFFAETADCSAPAHTCIRTGRGMHWHNNATRYYPDLDGGFIWSSTAT
jgi:hypothetical protein